MKCNFKKAILRQQSEPLVNAYETTKRMWEMATLVALNREFGFGPARLERVVNAVRSVYEEMDDKGTMTDKYDRGKGEYTNISQVVIGLVRELRSIGVDHRKILGDAELILTDKNGNEKSIDDIVDRMEEFESR